jgi:hypothetical protein
VDPVTAPEGEVYAPWTPFDFSWFESRERSEGTKRSLPGPIWSGSQFPKRVLLQQVSQAPIEEADPSETPYEPYECVEVNSVLSFLHLSANLPVSPCVSSSINRPLSCILVATTRTIPITTASSSFSILRVHVAYAYAYAATQARRQDLNYALAEMSGCACAS